MGTRKPLPDNLRVIRNPEYDSPLSMQNLLILYGEFFRECSNERLGRMDRGKAINGFRSYISRARKNQWVAPIASRFSNSLPPDTACSVAIGSQFSRLVENSIT